MKYSLLLLILSFFSGCRESTKEADAYGNFENTEITVSAETSGRIIRFSASEGVILNKGDEIALIDTTLFHLQKAEIEAGMKSVKTKMSSINAQNDILTQQIDNVKINIKRIENMLRDEAATKKQYDDLAGQVAVFEKQIAANNTQKATVAAELSVYETKKATLNEQIIRSIVKSPLEGTLIEKYAEEGELITTGRPLAKVANLTDMKLRVYVSGAQLGDIKTGQQCTVRIDKGEKDYSTFNGTISYISGKAEFTPKIIQTKEERVTLVYAVVIDVKNDGTMKAGMPGEAIF